MKQLFSNLLNDPTMKTLLIFITLCYTSNLLAQLKDNSSNDTLSPTEIQEKIKALENQLELLNKSQAIDRSQVEKNIYQNINKSKNEIGIGLGLMGLGLSVFIAGATAKEEEPSLLNIFSPDKKVLKKFAGTIISLTGGILTIKGSRGLKKGNAQLKELNSQQIILSPGKVGYLMTF